MSLGELEQERSVLQSESGGFKKYLSNNGEMKSCVVEVLDKIDKCYYGGGFAATIF